MTSAIIFYFDRPLELTQGFGDVVGVKGFFGQYYC